jgi:hypothetical protein
MKDPRKNAKERKDFIQLNQILQTSFLCVLLCSFADFIFVCEGYRFLNLERMGGDLRELHQELQNIFLFFPTIVGNSNAEIIGIKQRQRFRRTRTMLGFWSALIFAVQPCII